MRPEPATPTDRRPRWVIPELDVDGRIDAHTLLCLRIAIVGGCEHGALRILVDLRELRDIDPEAVTQFARHDAECRAVAVELRLLVRPDARQDAVVDAFSAAGLGDRLQWDRTEPAGPPDPGRPVSVRRRARRSVTAHPSASGSSPT